MKLNELSAFSFKHTIIFESKVDITLFYHSALLGALQRNETEVKEMVEKGHKLRYSDYN